MTSVGTWGGSDKRYETYYSSIFPYTLGLGTNSDKVNTSRKV